MANHRALSHNKIFWGQSLAALLLLIISLKRPVIVGGSLLKLAASCWVERTWGNSRPCVMMITPFAGMSIISTKSGRNLPGQGPGTSASQMGWSQRMMSKRSMAKRILKSMEWTKIAARRFFGISPVEAYHHWLSFCLEEAALFQRFEVSHFVCLV